MIKSLLRMLLLGSLLGTTLTALADAPNLRSDQPGTYYVKEGDTLWDIASKFLQEPWQWPQIWQKNTQVSNPHLIYPGDVLRLNYVNGQPQISVERGEQGQQADSGYPTVKLSPKAQEHSIAAAIPTVSLDAIQSFLMEGQVTNANQMKQSPYLLGGVDSREMWGRGDTIYVRDPVNKWKETASSEYGVYRTGERYVDPETKEVLGYEAVLVGHVRMVTKKGDIATMKVVDSRQDLQVGDRILPGVAHEQIATYFPDAPDGDINGRIIRMFGAVNSVARNDVVVVNKGQREGLREGNLLEIIQPGEMIKDTQMKQFVRLPAQKAGTLLLFRVFDKVSYGLIMQSTQPITMNDRVKNPK